MTAAGSAVTLTGHAYEQIRGDIIGGRVAPDSPLRLAALAADMGVSMSVVREALTRLSAQGLVVALPNQGFRVAALSSQDLRELTDLRVNLECLALERAISEGDVHWEGAVVSAHHVLERTSYTPPDGDRPTSEWLTAHAAFHDALAAGCGSTRLLGLIRSLRDGVEVYRQWAGRLGSEGGRDVVGEHRRLMELATSRRADEACALLRQHIERTTEVLLASREYGAPAVTR